MLSEFKRIHLEEGELLVLSFTLPGILLHKSWLLKDFQFGIRYPNGSTPNALRILDKLIRLDSQLELLGIMPPSLAQTLALTTWASPSKFFLCRAFWFLIFFVLLVEKVDWRGLLQAWHSHLLCHPHDILLEIAVDRFLENFEFMFRFLGLILALPGLILALPGTPRRPWPLIPIWF